MTQFGAAAESDDEQGVSSAASEPGPRADARDIRWIPHDTGQRSSEPGRIRLPIAFVIELRAPRERRRFACRRRPGRGDNARKRRIAFPRYPVSSMSILLGLYWHIGRVWEDDLRVGAFGVLVAAVAWLVRAIR